MRRKVITAVAVLFILPAASALAGPRIHVGSFNGGVANHGISGQMSRRVDIPRLSGTTNSCVTGMLRLPDGMLVPC
jgi:hypothetical protein